MQCNVYDYTLQGPIAYLMSVLKYQNWQFQWNSQGYCEEELRSLSAVTQSAGSGSEVPAVERGHCYWVILQTLFMHQLLWTSFMHGSTQLQTFWAVLPPLTWRCCGLAGKSSVSWSDVHTKEFKTAHLLICEAPVFVFPVLLLSSTNNASTSRQIILVSITHEAERHPSVQQLSHAPRLYLFPPPVYVLSLIPKTSEAAVCEFISSTPLFLMFGLFIPGPSRRAPSDTFK